MAHHDEAGWFRATLLSLALILACAPTPVRAQCAGDCNGDSQVTVDEIVTMVGIAVDGAAVSRCTAGDTDRSGAIEINEIIAAVNVSLIGMCEAGGCGDGVTELPEECDDGGICIGGSNAGVHCTRESNCDGDGVCEGGAKPGTSCTADLGCGGGRCTHCKTFGGDGCAANCTTERDIPVHLVPGRVVGTNIAPGTSGGRLSGESLILPIPFSGTETITVGKPDTNGVIPAVLKAASVHFDKIPVSTLACVCIRGVAYKTCGGTLFEADGSASPSCSEGFQGKVTCPPDKACTYAYGEGNAGTAQFGCGAGGLPAVGVNVTQDAGGEQGTPGPAVVRIGPPGGPIGSAVVTSSTAVGAIVGACPASFCTDADPLAQRGTPAALPLTTGEACCEVTGANDSDGVDIGPVCVDGAPFSCDALTSGSTSASVSGTLASAFPTLDQPTVGDSCLSSRLVLQ